MIFMFFPFGTVQLGAGSYAGMRCFFLSLPTDCACCVRSLADRAPASEAPFEMVTDASSQANSRFGNTGFSYYSCVEAG